MNSEPFPLSNTSTVLLEIYEDTGRGGHPWLWREGFTMTLAFFILYVQDSSQTT